MERPLSLLLEGMHKWWALVPLAFSHQL